MLAPFSRNCGALCLWRHHMCRPCATCAQKGDQQTHLICSPTVYKLYVKMSCTKQDCVSLSDIQDRNTKASCFLLVFGTFNPKDTEKNNHRPEDKNPWTPYTKTSSKFPSDKKTDGGRKVTSLLFCFIPHHIFYSGLCFDIYTQYLKDFFLPLFFFCFKQ